jgi:transposase
MSYIRQASLFSYQEFFTEKDDNSRLLLVFDQLADERLLSWLQVQRRGRRNDYPWAVLWRCLLAKYVYQIRTYAELIRELHRNGSLRWLVGIDNPERVPRDYHFTRLLKLLSSDEGQARLDEMLTILVAQLGEALPQLGRTLAVDATAVHAYSNEERKVKSDPEAAWSARPKRQRKSETGPAEQRLEYWFGYLVHLVVDCETELPIAYEVTAANVNETTRFRPLLEGLQQAQPEVAARTEVVTADAGYDSKENCKFVLKDCQALPIIKMRKTLPRDAICQAATAMCNELGTPLCASGHKLKYWGRDGDYLKWRCPVACGAQVQCTVRGRCSGSKYGNVLKISVWEDPRRWPGLARESKKWSKLYKRRTAAERVNARLKDYLQLDQLTVRGLAKVKVHTALGLVVLLAGALAMAQEGRVEAVRQTVRLAA